MSELFSDTTASTLHSLSIVMSRKQRACHTAAELGGVTSARGLFKYDARAGRYRPVLALAALELAVEGAGARPTGDGRRSGAGFTVQSQVDGGSHTALLQVNALRTPLMAQVG